MSSHPAYIYGGVLVRVIDADTLVVDLDLGLRVWSTQPLRLVGVDAPELRTAAGKAARQWVIEWCAETDGALLVTTEKNPEKYGRWLALIQRPGGGVTLNEALLDAGHASPYPVGSVRGL